MRENGQEKWACRLLPRPTINLSANQTQKTSLIRTIAVWVTGVSRHHGNPIKGFSETYRTSRFKGRALTYPHYAERRQFLGRTFFRPATGYTISRDNSKRLKFLPRCMCKQFNRMFPSQQILSIVVLQEEMIKYRKFATNRISILLDSYKYCHTC